MKKVITAFLCLTMIFSLSMTAFSAEINSDKKSKGVDISTAVPTNHIVNIVKDENAIISYDGNLLENGDKISVIRLSSPEFLIYSKDGFAIREAKLDADSVLNSLKNGRFTIESIHKDATLTVNSKKTDFVPQRKYIVVGTITENGKPLNGAELRLCEKPPFITKDDGKFTFENVEDGPHTLTAFNNDKQVGYIAFEIRQSDVVKTIEIVKADDGTFIINIGKDYNIIELNFDLNEKGDIDIPDGGVHETPNDIIDFPQTGDNTSIILSVFITFCSLTVIAMLIKKRKYENRKDRT